MNARPPSGLAAEKVVLRAVARVGRLRVHLCAASRLAAGEAAAVQEAGGAGGRGLRAPQAGIKPARQTNAQRRVGNHVGTSTHFRGNAMHAAARATRESYREQSFSAGYARTAAPPHRSRAALPFEPPPPQRRCLRRKNQLRELHCERIRILGCLAHLPPFRVGFAGHSPCFPALRPSLAEACRSVDPIMPHRR